MASEVARLPTGSGNIQFAAPYFPQNMREAILRDLEQVLESGHLINGAFCAALEDLFVRYLARPHAIGVTTCTTALQICLQRLDLRGGEVLVPAAGFTTDLSTVKWAGGTPVLVDIEADGLSFDPADLRRKLSSRTKAIIWVHLAGLISPAWREIVAFARDNGLYLIEDCAHALGASIDGKRAGAFGDTACFSFYPTKLITGGTGGMIATHDPSLDRFAREMRFFGRENGSGRVVREGNDWLLDEFRAVVTYHQFLGLAAMLGRRRALAGRYDHAFHGLNDVDLVMRGKGEPSYYHYVLLLESGKLREAVSRRLAEQFNIPSRPIYLALQEEPVFREFDSPTLGSAAEVLGRSICLPMHPNLSDDDVDWVAERFVTTLAACR